MKNLKNYKTNQSIWSDYKLILWTAFLLRMIAAIFSQGYGMHDDHFLVIEASGSWVEGFDYNKWLPWHPENKGPEGHSFTYVGLNFIFFYLLKFVGIVDPKVMMLFARVVHALFSMLTVIYGIKITEKLSNKRAATIVGWILAALWILPNISVRQLFETTPIPFLMIAIWWLIKDNSYQTNKGLASPNDWAIDSFTQIQKIKFANFFYAGLMLGLATSFRYQIGVFAIGIAAVYFFQFKWKPFFLFCLGVLVMFFLTQGVVDFMIWGYPFAEMLRYVTYNMNEGTEYMKNTNYFMYFFVLIGSLLFPLGILVFVGFFKIKKEYLLLFVPSILFLLFHTWYPNRQERFILTILPIFIILGVIGFEKIKKNGFDSKLWRISWISFWALNIPLLIFATTMYSKKSRVEAMYSIYEPSMKPKNILVEGVTTGDPSLLPRFYSKDWKGLYATRKDKSEPLKVVEWADYDYIFFFDDEDLPNRIKEYKTIYPKMTLHKKCYPSNLDVLLRTLNPNNKNEYIEVWKTNK